VSDGSGRVWLGVAIGRKADLNWKLQISNSSFTIAGLYGDLRHVAMGCTGLVIIIVTILSIYVHRPGLRVA